MAILSQETRDAFTELQNTKDNPVKRDRADIINDQLTTRAGRREYFCYEHGNGASLVGFSGIVFLGFGVALFLTGIGMGDIFPMILSGLVLLLGIFLIHYANRWDRARFKVTDLLKESGEHEYRHGIEVSKKERAFWVHFVADLTRAKYHIIDTYRQSFTVITQRGTVMVVQDDNGELVVLENGSPVRDDYLAATEENATGEKMRTILGEIIELSPPKFWNRHQGVHR